jgi:hypothetical protein
MNKRAEDMTPEERARKANTIETIEPLILSRRSKRQGIERLLKDGEKEILIKSK